jgi:hypothetical protein
MPLRAECEGGDLIACDWNLPAHICTLRAIRGNRARCCRSSPWPDNWCTKHWLTLRWPNSMPLCVMSETAVLLCQFEGRPQAQIQLSLQRSIVWLELSSGPPACLCFTARPRHFLDLRMEPLVTQWLMLIQETEPETGDRPRFQRMDLVQPSDSLQPQICLSRAQTIYASTSSSIAGR